MPNRKFLPLMVTVLATMVVGCDGDDKKDQFLEPEQKVTRLVAFPQAFVLKKGQVQSVNISNSVLAENVPNWKLTSLDDKSELGEVLSQDERSFDYSVENAGVGHLNYTVSDRNLTSSSQVVLAVNDGSTVGNNPPVAQNITLETNDGSNVSVDLRNFISDEDGDTLQITSLISGTGRFVLAEDGYQVTFTPGDYVGIDQAVYSVDDGKGGYALAYIIVNAGDSTSANTPPEAEDQAVTMDVADQANINIDLSDLVSDADGDTLAVDNLYSTNNRAILSSNNNVVYTPGDFRGVDQFTYKVTDGRGANALATITVTVVDSAVQPEEPTLTAYPQTLSVEQGASVIVNVSQSVTFNNIDGWELTSVEDETGLGVVSDVNSPSFNYQAQTPGVATLNYRVNGGDLESMSTIIVVINGPPSPDNTPPVAKNIALTTTNDTSVSVNLADQVSDTDGDALVISSLISASGRFSLNGDTVTFTPNGFVGVDQASYIVEDGKGGFASAYVVVNSEDSNPLSPNSPPEAQDYSYVLDANVLPTWTFDLIDLNLISDADGDLLTIENIYSTDGRAVKVGDTGISYSPGSFRGLDQFTYTVVDGNGGTAIGSINVAVNDSTPDNTIPTAGAISTTMSDTELSKTISVSGSVSDADGDPLEIVDLIASIGEVNVNPDNPLEIIYEPNGFVGEDKFVYVISDGQGGLAMATVTVTVVQSNPNPPVANIVQIETTPDLAKTVDLSAYISDSETPTSELLITNVTSATSPAVVTLNGQSITYTPNGYIGVDTLIYTVSDGELTDTGDIVIISSPDAGHDLNANDVSVTTDAGVTVEIDLSSQISTSDTTAEPLILVSAVGASLGDVVIDDANKKLIYTPKVGDYGKDVFVYNIKDSHEPAHFAQGLVSVDILPPPLPEITSLTVSGIPTIGGVLSSNVICTTCNASQYEYEWSIDGLVVATTSTYAYQATNPDLSIRLEVTGRDIYGQTTSEYSVYRVSVTTEIYSASRSFAALKNDGSVVTWGTGLGADSSGVDLSSEVETIYSNQTDYAALKSDGSVVTWGRALSGGDSSSVSTELSEGVVKIYAADFAFVAIKDDGQVVTWGSADDGGDSSGADLTGTVLDIASVSRGFAALKEDDTVETWGRALPNRTSGVDYNTGVKEVYANGVGFVGIKYDGTLSYWGQGDGMTTFLTLDFSAGVKDIMSTSNSFLTLLGDNSVLAWGSSSRAGVIPATVDTTNVRSVYSNTNKFALLRWDKTVSSWERTTEDAFPLTLTNIETVIPTNSNSGFSAIAEDGSVYAWGSDFTDGQVSGVSLLPDAVIRATNEAFAAIDQNGDVVTWGDRNKGGQVPNSVNDEGNGIRSLYSSLDSFMVIKNDWSVETWGTLSDDPPALAQPYIAIVETSIAP
ncbi:Ig-like domain-containing protein [Vibrio jasicida]|uniref:Ig-like domain-containing protein n=1 Tax=Vibrio jasicida TaxID=766224 RepID=UPI000CE37978|nr:tandem-95 repeat protein [Vibrio jasicida]